MQVRNKRKLIREQEEKGSKRKQLWILWVVAVSSSNSFFMSMLCGEQGREGALSL